MKKPTKRPRKSHLIVAFIICYLLLCLSAGCQTNKSITTPASPLAKALPAIHIEDNDPVTMRLIPAGSFMMGCIDGDSDEQPTHRVYLEAFYMDEAEVTCARYARFLNQTGHPPHPLWNPEYDRPQDPVVGVRWYDARAFARWAGKRLPTEAEWEKAAKAGTASGTKTPAAPLSKDSANFNSFGTMPVKSFAPSAVGLYDMMGNVWEWCADWYSRTCYHKTAADNPAGPVINQNNEYAKKVIRGGAWSSAPNTLRLTNRHKNDPLIGSFNIGFRCVKSAKHITDRHE